MDKPLEDLKVNKWKKLLCSVPEWWDFPRDGREERLYRAYTKRQRQRAVPQLLIAGLLLQGFVAMVPGESDLEFAYTLASVGFVINLLLLAVYLSIQRFRPALLHITWVALWVQLLISVSRRHERTFNELLGWAALFQYLTVAALPFHFIQLLICSVLSIASYLGVQYVNAAFADFSFPHDFLFQQIANLVLLVATTLLGGIAYAVTEGQQRASFQETKSSLRDKLTIEQQSKEQERLLLSVLPEHVAVQMRKELGLIDTQFKKIYMSRHENVSILYADIVGFTAISSTYSAQDLVAILNELFARFDRLAEKYHQLRIKILGDCYYCISGAPVERPDHAVLCVHMGLSMVKAIKYVQQTTNSPVDMRVGIHTGAVLAGVLGQTQWQFDVYSRDVELANKMESSGKAGRVHVSEVTLGYLNDEFEVEPAYGEKREEILRQAGIKTYFITRVLKPFQGGEERQVDGELEGEDPDTLSDLRDEDEDSVLSPQDENQNDSESRILSMLEEELVNRDDDRVETVGEPGWVSSCVGPRGGGAVQTATLVTLLLLAAVALIPETTATKNLAIIYFTSIIETFTINITLYAYYKYQRKKVNVLVSVVFGIFNILMLTMSNAVSLYVCATLEEMAKDDLLPDAPSHGNIRRCDHPSYFFQTGVGLLVGVGGTGGGWKIRAIVMVAVSFAHCSTSFVSMDADLFSEINHFTNVTDYDTQNVLLGLHIHRHLFMLMFITLALLGFDRYCEEVEKARAWRGRRMRDQAEQASELRRRNLALVHNVLPPHVAQHFMGARRSHRDLYSQSYGEVGVLFASMPNFSEFYSEETVNNQGLECLRFLNEVISDFDSLLEDPKYNKDITKIKTISSTYMAASGLNPTRQMQESDGVTVRWAHLALLVQFALELQRVLAAINEQSFNHFVLRLGVNHGPITAGVIGARKPHYDIWGNTVNVASRMESTGKAGCIQVTEETCHILEQFGYYFEQRGLVAVKGKGQLMTYYLMGCNKDGENEAQCSLDDLMGEEGPEKALLSNGTPANNEAKMEINTHGGN